MIQARAFLAIFCSALLVSWGGAPLAQPAPAAAAAAPAPKIPPDQLDSLVAPIALNPDPLLAQTLVASTYPLEIIRTRDGSPSSPRDGRPPGYFFAFSSVMATAST